MTDALKKRRIFASVLLALSLASTTVPLLPAVGELPVWKHHLVHAVVLALAAWSGLLLARPGPSAAEAVSEPCTLGWVLVTVLAPVGSMFLMWPTSYDWLERHPLAHAAQHLGFVLLGFSAAYGGERCVRGVGWVSAVATVATALAAAGGFGVVLGR